MTNWNNDFDKRWARDEKMGNMIFGTVIWGFRIVLVIIILTILAQVGLAAWLISAVSGTDPKEAAGSLGEIVRAFEESRKGE
jgi:hypothetical protein